MRFAVFAASWLHGSLRCCISQNDECASAFSAAGMLRYPNGGGPNNVFSSFVCSLRVCCRGVSADEKRGSVNERLGGIYAVWVSQYDLTGDGECCVVFLLSVMSRSLIAVCVSVLSVSSLCGCGVLVRFLYTDTPFSSSLAVSPLVRVWEICPVYALSVLLLQFLFVCEAVSHRQRLNAVCPTLTRGSGVISVLVFQRFLRSSAALSMSPAVACVCSVVSPLSTVSFFAVCAVAV